MLPFWWLRNRSTRSNVHTGRSVARQTLTLEALEGRDVPSVVAISSADPSFSSSSATANGQSETSPEHSVSSDGTYVVFISTGSNLVANETKNGSTSTQNVYLYDTTTQTTTLISHDYGSTTEQGSAASFDPVISSDGSTVAFFSSATDLISGDTINSGTVQLYLYDVSSGALTLVTHDSSNTSHGGDASLPYLPSTPANDYGAVNTLAYYAAVPSYGIVGGGEGLPSLSDNGQYVAFISNASDLGFTMPTGSLTGTTINEVFLYDQSTGDLTLVSHESGTTATELSTGAECTGFLSEGYASTVSISGDGSTVAFTAPFDNLISGDTVDGVNDNLYVWSRIDNSSVTGLSAGQIVLATFEYGDSTTGASIPSASYLYGFTGDNPPSLSDNGAYVAYYDAGDNLVDNQGGTASVLNVFRYDVLNNDNELVTHVAGTTSTDLTTAGSNPANAVAALGVGPAEATGPQISSDGTYITYANNSDNLISTTSPFTTGGSTYNGADQVYQYDASTETNTLISFDGSSTTPTPTGATAPSVSSNGQYVSYIAWAYPASGTATPAVGTVYVYNSSTGDQTSLGTAYQNPLVGTGNTTLSSDDTATIDGAILAPTVMNSDGRVVLWDGSSTANDTNDSNAALDVFLLDQAPIPTQLSLSQLNVPDLNGTTVGQFQTTATPTGRTFQYTLVSGTGDTNNAQFTVSGSSLVTASNFVSTFSASPQSTYSILAQTTDTTFSTSYLTQQFTLNVIQAPTGLTASQTSVPDVANTAFTQFTTTDPTSGRTYQYSLVTGSGNDSLFTINPSTGQLSTGSSFPVTGQSTFTVYVVTTDSQFSGLTYQQSFTFTLVTPPTNVTASTSGVPATAGTSFAQLSTASATSGRTYQYSLVSGTGGANNALFTINPTTGALSTAAGFPAAGVSTYHVLVQATDTQFSGLSVQVPLTFTVVNPPASIQLSTSSFTAGSNQVVATFSIPGSNRLYQYALVSGPGSTNNALFTINGQNLTTVSGFPPTGGTYSILVQVTDTQFPSLTFTQLVTLNVAAAQPAQPNLTFPAQLTVFQGTPAALSIAAAPGDASSVVTVTISGVPDGVTFSAGTNNGNGTWTFTPSQLSGLMIDTTTPGSIVLSVVATAAFPSGGQTSTASGPLQVTIVNATPTITVSAPDDFNPLNPLTVTVSSTAPGVEVVQSVTINWGDGTTETFAGPPGSYTHQYAVLDSSYAVQVSVTDQNGTFSPPNPTTVTAVLATQQQGVVASLYVDILGRSADAAGLANFSDMLASGTSVTQLITDLVGSSEYKMKVINDLYEEYLGRPADSAGLATYLPVLAAHGPEAVAADILGSAEFYADAGGTPQGYLRALYLAVLDRPLDSGGTGYLNALEFGVSRQQIAQEILASPEAARDAVEQAYDTYLGRPADPASLQSWEQVYISDPATFLVTFLTAAEPEIAQKDASLLSSAGMPAT